jgi:hypothetical protein
LNNNKADRLTSAVRQSVFELLIYFVFRCFSLVAASDAVMLFLLHLEAIAAVTDKALIKQIRDYLLSKHVDVV